MKIKELLLSVAKLVEERDIIDHGSIRMIHSDQAVREIESAEGCEEVETGTIGDDDLSERLEELAEDPADIDFDDLKKLEDAHRGDDLADYVQDEKEDELGWLEKLIDAAKEL